ncbi:3-keto-5-aminohexanoate cleavage protein [Polaromonas sp.]|uniref:3-keto-5-aminohexanoate cleavage protein n=1 Tax=Polaromonas sp. TaxID=1869339 RepID=UPI0032635496
MEPLVICAALTGGGPPHANTPHHPVTPQAIADEALAAWRAGAAIVHCHARLEDGTATNDPAVYRDLFARIRDTGCEAIINFSAGDNGGRSSHVQRLSVIDTGAEIVSLGGGSFNIGARTYDNSPAFRLEMATRMRACGVTPEFELFDMGQVDGLRWIRDHGLMPAKPMVTLAVGIPGALPANLDVLQTVLKLLPPEAHWAMSCQTRDFAIFQRFMLVAFALGGHIRTGMEDFVFVRPGVLAKSNAEMVTQWVDMAAIWGRPVASAQQAREQLGIGSFKQVVVA